MVVIVIKTFLNVIQFCIKITLIILKKKIKQNNKFQWEGIFKKSGT